MVGTGQMTIGMHLPPDEPFTPGTHAFFHGCVGFLLVFLGQVAALGMGLEPIAVGSIMLTLFTGAGLTAWLGSILARGARGGTTPLHVVLGGTRTGRRFLWSLGLVPFPMLWLEYRIWSAVGEDGFAEVTGVPMARGLIMAAAVLLVTAWLLEVILLWFQATAVGRSTTRHCLHCGHPFSRGDLETCPECGCHDPRTL